MGSFLVQQLAQDPGVKKPVRSVDICPARPGFPADGAVHQIVDIRRPESVHRVLEGVDSVFLVAAVIDQRLSPDPIGREVNVLGCANVISGCRSAGAQRLVYTSTMDVVGIGLRMADESWPYAKEGVLAPAGGYSQTKAEAERLVLTADEDGGLATVALRITHMFGPGDDVLPLMALSPIGMGPRRAKQSQVYVENAASAHVQAARRLAEPAPVRGQAFFISDFDENLDSLYAEITGAGGPCVRVPFWVLLLVAVLLEVLALVVYKCLFRLRLPYVWHPKKTFGFCPLHHVACDHTSDPRAARERLGYSPLVDKAEALARTRRWYQDRK